MASFGKQVPFGFGFHAEDDDTIVVGIYFAPTYFEPIQAAFRKSP